MKLHAYVMHNVGPTMFWEYDAEHLHHAHTFQIEADSIDKAAELVWVLTNVGSEAELRMNFSHLSQYASQVTAYRARRNRSVSVGDAVVFFERERPAGARACASIGWTEIPFNLDTLTNVSNDRPKSDSSLAHEEFARNPRWTPGVPS